MKTSRTPPPPDPNEPTNVAEAIASWGLDYVVITSVDRDDLPDQGSGHFAETVQKLKALKPNMLIEALGMNFCASLDLKIMTMDTGKRGAIVVTEINDRDLPLCLNVGRDRTV